MHASRRTTSPCCTASTPSKKPPPPPTVPLPTLLESGVLEAVAVDEELFLERDRFEAAGKAVEAPWRENGDSSVPADVRGGAATATEEGLRRLAAAPRPAPRECREEPKALLPPSQAREAPSRAAACRLLTRKKESPRVEDR